MQYGTRKKNHLHITNKIKIDGKCNKEKYLPLTLDYINFIKRNWVSRKHNVESYIDNSSCKMDEIFNQVLHYLHEIAVML